MRRKSESEKAFTADAEEFTANGILVAELEALIDHTFNTIPDLDHRSSAIAMLRDTTQYLLARAIEKRYEAGGEEVQRLKEQLAEELRKGK